MKEIVLPSDIQLERFVLASMLSSIDSLNEGMSHLTAEDFTYPKHAAIYIAMTATVREDLACTPQNLMRFRELPRQGLEEFELEDLYDLVGCLPYGAKFSSEAKILKNLNSLRRIIYASKEALISASDPQSQAFDIAAVLQNKLAHLEGASFKTKDPESILKNFDGEQNFETHINWVIDRVKQGLSPYVGISSGYKRLDEMIGTFRPQCLYYIGARTSVGKTTFMLNLIRNMSIKESSLPIGFFSLEMPAETMVKKLMCMFAGVNYNNLEDGKLVLNEVDRVLGTQSAVSKMKIYIEDPNSLKLSQLMSRARRMKAIYDIQILFVDYLTRVRSDVKHNSKHLEVDEISKGLQSLAKELKIPIICLCQLNRGAEGEDVEPGLAHFRESGSIEEDADACFILTRPSKDKQTVQPGILNVKIAKNRLRGTLGTIPFSWQPGGNYEECEPIEKVVKNLTQSHLGYKDILDE